MGWFWFVSLRCVVSFVVRLVLRCLWSTFCNYNVAFALASCLCFFIYDATFLIFGDVCKTFHYWVDNYTEALDSSLLVCPIHDSVLSL